MTKKTIAAVCLLRLILAIVFPSALSVAQAEESQQPKGKAADGACPGEGLIFSKGETNLHCVTYGAGHVWCGLCTGNMVVKVDPQTMTRETIAMKGQGGLHDLCFDGKDVWGVHSSGHTSKVDAPTNAVQTIRTAGFAYTCCFDGRDIWVGLDTMPATLVKIDPNNFRHEVYALHAESSCCRALLAAKDYLWVGLYTEPAQIVRLDRKKQICEVVTLAPAYFNTRDLAEDGTNLWIGLQNVRYGPSALYRLPMAGPFPDTQVFQVAPSTSPIEPRVTQKQPAPEAGEVALTSQDWYRVRRGEDEIAWGKMEAFDDLPRVVLSRRAAAELTFLGTTERRDVSSRLRELSAGPAAALSKPVSRGEPRRLDPVGKLRIVFQVREADQKIHVSTIRKEVGVSFDPEVMGPVPRR